MLLSHVSRIAELHEALLRLIEAGQREKVYDRAGKQEKLDRALLPKGLCRAIDAPYFPGDSLSDSVSYIQAQTYWYADGIS